MSQAPASQPIRAEEYTEPAAACAGKNPISQAPAFKSDSSIQKVNLRYAGQVQSTFEQKGPTQVQLNIEVPPEEIKEIKAGTLKRLSKEVKVPGFRQGKVPPT